MKFTYRGKLIDRVRRLERRRADCFPGIKDVVRDKT